MSKFAIFTVILAVSVVTITVDFLVRDYLVKTGQASVLQSEEISPVLSSEETIPDPPETVSVQPAAPSSTSPAESPSPPSTTLLPPASLMTDAIITDAGFLTATFTEKHFEGKVFQLLDITKIPVDAISFYQLADDAVTVVSVTEIILRDEIRALQLYILLQNKTKPYIDLKLNETNAYGDRSFYINHDKKPDEAFLVTKIGRSIYAFAYVKTYHPQIKKLIQLLSST